MSHFHLHKVLHCRVRMRVRVRSGHFHLHKSSWSVRVRFWGGDLERECAGPEVDARSLCGVVVVVGTPGPGNGVPQHCDYLGLG